MKFLKKVWVRVILSLIVGAVIAELVHYKTGISSQQFSSIILLLVGTFTFGVLSFSTWLSNNWNLFSPKNKDRNDILDE